MDVVWVSTPNIYHCENTIAAAENGKHVVVEKPMAVTMEEAERMVEAAERNGVNLLCGHTASLMAGFRAMRRVISSGRGAGHRHQLLVLRGLHVPPAHAP